MEKIKFNDLLDYEQPQKYIVPNELYDDNGEYPVLTAGKSFILGRTNNYNEIYKDLPTIIFDDFTCDCKYVDFPFVVKSSAMKMLKPKNDNVNLKYCFYYMNYIDYKISEHKRHWISIYSQLDIKKHDLKTQQKIIDELDCLSDIIEKKKQQLADLDNLIKSQFIEMFDLYNKENNFLDVLIDDTKNGFKFDSNHYKSNGEIPIIDQGEEFICGFKNKEPDKQPYKYESIVFGDHTERFKYLNFDYYLGADGAKILRCKNGYNTTFVYWFMKIFYIPVGGYSRHFKFLKELLFSKPPIELQNQFAGFVENIEKSKNDIKQSIEETQNLMSERMQHYFGD